MADEFAKGKDIEEKIKLVKNIKDSSGETEQDIWYGVRVKKIEDIEKASYYAYSQYGILHGWGDEVSGEESDHPDMRWFDDQIDAERFQIFSMEGNYKKMILKNSNGDTKYGIEPSEDTNLMTPEEIKEKIKLALFWI